MCEEGDGGRCRTNGVTYEITCKSCNDVYVGETSRNAYTRGKWHMQSVTGKSGENDPTLKHHILTRHVEDEVRPTFKMKDGGGSAPRSTKEVPVQNGVSLLTRSLVDERLKNMNYKMEQ